MTVVQHTVDGLGLSVVEKLPAKHFSVMGGGKIIYNPNIHLCLSFFLIRYSVLPALSLNDGILHCDIIEGSFDTDKFYTFIGHVLDKMQPFPAPNSVIVMDNCQIHKHPAILELIESRYACLFILDIFLLTFLLLFRGMRCEFLPPYSPDYNPIELAFSAMKYHLCRNGAKAKKSHVQGHVQRTIKKQV